MWSEKQEDQIYMGEVGSGEIKHILLAKFKNEVRPIEIESLIKGFANLVSLIPSMKSFHWGLDASEINMHEGFTHVFESTFDNMEGVAEYINHPAHVEFSLLFLANVDKLICVDYKPTAVPFHL